MDGVVSIVKLVESSSKKPLRYSDVMSRILAMALTLVAAVLTGFDKETANVSATITGTLPTVHVPVTAKWQYMSALVYFLASNAIAGAYAVASVLLSMVVKEKGELALVMADLMMMGLLFSANSAAIAVGIIGRDGNSHVHWTKVCNVFDGFCRHLTVAIVLSLIGSFVFLCLVALAVLNLHKKLRHTVK